MNLLDWKLLSLALLAGGSCLTCLLTVALGRRVGGGKREASLLLLLSGGAGCVLATSVLHLLPHIRLILATPGQQLGISFLPELLISSGFFLLYILEEVVELVVGLARDGATPSNTLTDCSQDNHVQRQDLQGEQGGEEQQEQEEEENEEADGNTNSSYNPKYSVKLSQSTNTMFPNYHSPDSIIVLQSTELKRNSSVRSHKTSKLTSSDPVEPAGDRIRTASALRDLLLGKTLSSL